MNFWERQMKQLSERFRTIALDLRGHGDSGGKPGIDYSISRMSDDIHELVDGLGLKDCLFVGHSLGAAIVVKFVAKYGMTSGIVLTGASRQIQSGLSVFFLELLMRFRGLAEKVVTPRMFAPNAPGELLEFVRSESKRSSAEVLMAVMRQIAGADSITDLKKIEVPAIVVAGEFDGIIAPEEQRRVADILDAKFIVMKGAGHNLMLEEPGAFSKLIEEFALSLSIR